MLSVFSSLPLYSISDSLCIFFDAFVCPGARLSACHQQSIKPRGVKTIQRHFPHQTKRIVEAPGNNKVALQRKTCFPCTITYLFPRKTIRAERPKSLTVRTIFFRFRDRVKMARGTPRRPDGVIDGRYLQIAHTFLFRQSMALGLWELGTVRFSHLTSRAASPGPRCSMRSSTEESAPHWHGESHNHQ